MGWCLNWISSSTLLVPFRSSMEADIAGHLLAPRGQPQPGRVHQEVTVSGTLLTIRLTAEDVDQLRLSISSCLQELFLLIQNMWHTMPPFFLLNPTQLRDFKDFITVLLPASGEGDKYTHFQGKDWPQ
ncbi:hypothetical protein QTO34_000169 [Cnephaeus nilssonii]|uniref:L antigen family member 3 n=1 Tax=Cnephaeus nilssonii TaxID=3371016 RepID=A0AA40IB31_CNENI|nr:hypothetical protein QTO34_000169 [Eptesicus nilssonii]